MLAVRDLAGGRVGSMDGSVACCPHGVEGFPDGTDDINGLKGTGLCIGGRLDLLKMGFLE